VVVLVSTTLLTLAMSARGAEHPTPCNAVQLSRAGWDAVRSRSLARRSPTAAEAVASDLVRCQRLTGMTRRRVRDLLGPPDRAITRSGSRSASEWLYQLDLSRGILSHPAYLRVVFGRRGSESHAELAAAT
jgi:hypothetical protein